MTFCDRCPTILVFSGKWCPPCRALEQEFARLRHTQACGQFHFRQMEFSLQDETTEGSRLTRAFNVDAFPTVLIFNPYRRAFVEYLGPQTFEAIVSCNVSELPLWPAPTGVRIDLAPLQRNVVEVGETTRAHDLHQQPLAGRIKLCANCPTAVYFALREDAFPHAADAHNDGIHALHFCNLQAHGIAFSLFGIRAFPTILVYCPRMNLFFVYEDVHMADLQSIKAAYHTRGKLRKTWNAHPRVELIR